MEMDAGMGQPYVALDFNAQGASIFEKLTGSNIRKRMAIVLDCFVNSAPVIMEKIGGGKARITLGAFNDAHAMKQEAEELVAVLRAGALPAPIVLVSEKMIGPAE